MRYENKFKNNSGTAMMYGMLSKMNDENKKQSSSDAETSLN